MAVSKKGTVTRLLAKERKIRNPQTGQMFNRVTPVDVVDIDAKENIWVKMQLDAGVLVSVPIPKEVPKDPPKDTPK